MEYWGQPSDLCIVCNSFIIDSKLKPRRKKVKKPLKYKVTRKQRQKLENGLGFEVTPHLRPFFVIKEIFKLPKQRVYEMLGNLGNPSEWFELCEPCSHSIDEGIEVLGKLKRLEKRFANIKNGLYEKVHTSRLQETEEEVETPGFGGVKTAYRKNIRNSLPTIYSELPVPTEQRGPEPEVKTEVIDFEAELDESQDESYFEPETLLETGDACDLVEPTSSQSWKTFIMVEMDSEMTSSDTKVENQNVSLSLTAEENGRPIEIKQEHSHIHLGAAAATPYNRPSKNTTTSSQPPHTLTSGVKCSGITQKCRTSSKQKWKSRTWYHEPTTDDEVQPDQSDGKPDIYRRKRVFDNYDDPSYVPGQPLFSTKRKRVKPISAKRKKILSEVEPDDEEVGFLYSGTMTRSQKYIKRAHSKGSVQRAKQMLRKCPQQPISAKRVGRPPDRLKWNRILDYGNEYLDMSLITYPPKTVEEKRKIPKDVVKNDTGVLKEYGELNVASENSCPSCGKYFSHKYFAISHIHRFHLGIQRHWTCNQCSRKFVDAKRFLLHLRLHDAGKIFCCPVCKSFKGSSQQEVDYHVVSHQEHVPNPACDSCGKAFIDFKSYLRHMSVEHGFEYRKKLKQHVVCEVCSKTFRSNRLLKFHQVSHHDHIDEGALFPICPHCGKLRKSSHDLERHIQKDHIKATNFFCDQCGSGFVLESQLKHHIDYIHSEVTKTCHVCNFVMKSTTRLSKHISKQHPEVLTMSVDELEAHKKKLNEEKPHKCTLCEKSFAFSVLMYHHYRNDHPEVTDKFKCDVCGKGYSRACSVKRHYESVHEKKMAQCQYCNKEIPISSMYQHQQSKSCIAKRKAEADANNSFTCEQPTTSSMNTTTSSQQTLVTTSVPVDLKPSCSRTQQHQIENLNQSTDTFSMQENEAFRGVAVPIQRSYVQNFWTHNAN